MLLGTLICSNLGVLSSAGSNLLHDNVSSIHHSIVDSIDPSIFQNSPDHERVVRKSKPKCPYSLRALQDPVKLANLAAEELLPVGRLREALVCTTTAAKAFAKKKYNHYPQNVVDSVAQNLRVLQNILATKTSFESTRIYHNFGAKSVDFPANSSDPLPAQATAMAQQHGIAVYDNVLSEAQCAELVHLFESSPSTYMYQGNVMRGGEIFVDVKHKKALEVDITGNAPHNATWRAVDEFLLGVTLRQLHTYEEEVSSLKLLPNPLGDDGFTMRRYDIDVVAYCTDL